VALVAGICLVLEAVIAKHVIDADLDFISLFAPFWVFIAYLVSGLRDRVSEISFMAAIVVTTVAVLLLYAL
jgi:hypothetical protein